MYFVLIVVYFVNLNIIQIGNDGGKQLYGSSEARSFSSSINSQQSIINGGGQQPVSSRHQQGGEVFQARALAANKEPFIQQVCSVFFYIEISTNFCLEVVATPPQFWFN